MDINKLITESKKPDLYTPGTHDMSDDEHILKQTLLNQINPSNDYSSRKVSTIKQTFHWILEKTGKMKMAVLDLGCGPGFYAESFAGRGHRVTAVDISGPAIAYAKDRAAQIGYDIEYIHGNFLQIHRENEFDLVIMIYNMFSSLLPHERKQLLSAVRKALKPEGKFVFDVLNDKNMEDKIPPASWSASEKSFWCQEPHLYLLSSFLYPEEKIVLYRHMITDLKNLFRTYHFWVRHFSHEDLDVLLRENMFEPLNYNENLIPENNQWDGSNITFVVAEKK